MRLLSRVILALPAGVAVAASAVASPASAAQPTTVKPGACTPYKCPPPKCTVTPASAPVGSTVSIIGVGFTAGATVTVKGSGTAVVVATSGKADSEGNVTVSGKAGSPGSGTFTLSSGTKSASCAVVVKPEVAPTTAVRTSPPVVNPIVLPNTGASGIGLEVGIGALLVLGGVGTVVLSSRRRTA